MKMAGIPSIGGLLDTSFPRTRESRFGLRPISLDTRFRGYDGTPVMETLPLHVFSEKASDYLRRQMRDGRIYVGFDVDDDGLGFAVQKAGRDAFVFGSDFPHEVFNAEKCRHEIDQLLARGDLNDADKAAVLGGNARRFYGLAAIVKT